MDNAPLVSVYITNHNYGRFIREAIESVLNQSLTDFELIIIDDGSTDDSRTIIESYADLENVQIIFQKNKGLNVTNNIAMRSARGKYLMRLDADDYLDHNALLVLSNRLEQEDDLGLVFPDYYMVDEEGEVLSLERRHDFDKEVSLFDQPAHGACTMIRRKFLLQLDGYDENFKCQDGYELWIKFTRAFKVSNVNTPLFFYRQHGHNLTSNEDRILTTRKAIKRQHFDSSGLKDPNTLAVIPIRGSSNSRYNIALEDLNGKKVLDWKIEAALRARGIGGVMVSSPDEKIGQYVESAYANNDRVYFHQRDLAQSRLNVSLYDTLHDILTELERKGQKFETVVTLSVEFPFLDEHTIEEAIRTMGLFDTDSVISVRAETSTFFQHHGDGMKAILDQDKFTKLERDALYRYTGGLTMASIKVFMSEKKLICGRVGHIVIDQQSAHGIFTNHDLDMARYLATKNEHSEVDSTR